MFVLTWLLQVLILASGIYVFLRFLRTTQGNRIVRGLAIALPVLIVGTWGTANLLGLEELQHIISGVSGFAVIIVAILFQEELRRGMAQFGENPLVRRFVPSFDLDVIAEVSRAALDMATRQETHGSFTRIRPHGALIAFERENSLQSYIDGGRRINALVSHELLETIFQPKSPLHDGAVILRKDRAAAASCMLPLTQNLGVAKSMGTRHRAALGLTEHTDAVTLVVSEETGKLSIAAGGELRSVTQGELEEELRRALGAGPEDQLPSFGQRVTTFVREDLVWAASAGVLAFAMLWFAHRDISTTQKFPVRIVDRTLLTEGASGEGLVVVTLPEGGHRLERPDATRSYSVLVTGSRAQLDQLGAQLSGSFELDLPAETEAPLSIDDVRWRRDQLGLVFSWDKGDTPLLLTERYETVQVNLAAAQVPVDPSGLDPHYEVGAEGVRFDADSVSITGPASLVAGLDDGSVAFQLEEILLGPEDVDDRSELLRLHPDLRARGFSLADGRPIRVTVPIEPVTHSLPPMDFPVTLVALRPEDQARVAGWRLPGYAQTVKVVILAKGLIPAKAAGTSLFDERRRAIEDYVRANLRVVVDVGDQPPGEEPRAVPIRTLFVDPDWRAHLAFAGLETGAGLARADLQVRIERIDPNIHLEPVPPSEGGDE